MAKHNSPDGPRNTPQHIFDQQRLPQGGDVEPPRWKHRQTGRGTSPDRDVADPHPSDEEHPYRADAPGRAGRPSESRQVGPNSRIHDGRPQPRPKNAESE